jgi:hypothetical protein
VLGLWAVANRHNSTLPPGTDTDVVQPSSIFHRKQPTPFVVFFISLFFKHKPLESNMTVAEIFQVPSAEKNIGLICGILNFFLFGVSVEHYM